MICIWIYIWIWTYIQRVIYIFRDPADKLFLRPFTDLNFSREQQHFLFNHKTQSNAVYIYLYIYIEIYVLCVYIFIYAHICMYTHIFIYIHLHQKYINTSFIYVHIYTHICTAFASNHLQPIIATKCSFSVIKKHKITILCSFLWTNI